MICKVKQTIEKYGLIDSSVRTVAVGFSGGADSVCLMDILSSFKDEYGIIIKAVHVNHNIRGAEAERDEMFVRRFCSDRNIELLCFSVPVPELAAERKISLEECGRQVRYECFEKAGCDAVAVAHTLSDSIETMLFNLARGTGAKGLSGISPSRKPCIIRPLIACTRKEIEAYCEQMGLEYVTDSTNLSDDYTRNHIRHNIVPAFEKINSDFESSFYRAMCSIRENDEYIEKSALRLLEDSRCEKGYRISVLLASDAAVIKRCLHLLIKEKMNKPPEAKHIEACFLLVQKGFGKIELSRDLYVVAENGIITFCAKQKLPEQWKCNFVNGVAVTPYCVIELTQDKSAEGFLIDADKIKDGLFVSSRLEGDTFTFKSRKVTKSLKKLFNEMKIPVEKRNRLSVLHDGKNVVWIEDIGVNAMYIPDKNTQKILTVKRTGKND